MPLAQYAVSVVQNTVYVFNKDIASPFNTWSAAAMAQGFSWREGSVGFLLLADFDPAILDARFELGRDASPAGAERVIRVPFRVDAPGAVDISGIYESEERRIAVPAGDYDLIFALSRPDTPDADDADARLEAVFSFVVGAGQPEVIKADEEITRPNVPVFDGKPA